ncbi:hypothetical protein HFD95_15085 [Pantoea sp. EKM10T]|uniref:hypothetical protein n=1 Tax=Pantoea sp. EKM10T TaxID=2708058 RepID=UPI00142D590C|nr:hypothetical protein [Pantoea sp. EKM10T]KAF6632104.1 hypothetical protein HFD95_15085 [Pantoea sp. EKM10T]
MQVLGFLQVLYFRDYRQADFLYLLPHQSRERPYFRNHFIPFHHFGLHIPALVASFRWLIDHCHSYKESDITPGQKIQLGSYLNRIKFIFHRIELVISASEFSSTSSLLPYADGQLLQSHVFHRQAP